jgi:hypothetical protein
VKFSYSIDEKSSIMRVKFSGELTVDEVMTFQKQLVADPRFRPGMAVLTDLSDAIFDWSLADLDKYRARVAQVKDVVGDAKWALVAAGGVTHVTARMFSVLHEAFQEFLSVRLFNTEQEALNWIDGKKFD